MLFLFHMCSKFFTIKVLGYLSNLKVLKLSALSLSVGQTIWPTKVSFGNILNTSLINHYKYVKRSVVNLYCCHQNAYFNLCLGCKEKLNRSFRNYNTIYKCEVEQLYNFHVAFKIISASYDKQMVLALAQWLSCLEHHRLRVQTPCWLQVQPLVRASTGSN